MNVQTVEQLGMVQILASIWSGRAKLRREDLPDTIDLPPEDVATLGSKRLYDPTKLRIFNTLKARAAGILDKKCIKFLGGWATHEDNLPDLACEMQKISAEFQSAKIQFLNEYDTGVEKWLEEFPKWSAILRNAIPTRDEVEAKFAFAWRMYKINPVDVGKDMIGNDLDDSLTTLEQQLFEEVAQSVREVYRECFDNKEVVTRKAFRPVHTLVQKVQGMVFLHPSVAGLEDVLRESLELVENHANSPAHVAMFKNFLLALQSPRAIHTICEEYITGAKSLADIFDPLWTTASAINIPAQATPAGFDSIPIAAPPVAPVMAGVSLEEALAALQQPGSISLNGFW